jgi:hypothetical protein
MPLTPTNLVPWLHAFLTADRDATVDDAPERRAAFCSAAVAEGLANLPVPEAPVVTRRLFKLEVHDHPSQGPWVAAHVSEATGARRGEGKYHLLLLVADHLGAPRVTGVYDVCTACVALGVDGQGRPCVECSGLGWEPWFGDDRGDDLGPVTVIERLVRPSTSLYHAAWKRGGAG